MPQSANDQVEPVPRLRPDCGQSGFNASVGKRSSGTLDAMQDVGWIETVSMPQSANDQVEHPPRSESETH